MPLRRFAPPPHWRGEDFLRRFAPPPRWRGEDFSREVCRLVFVLPARVVVGRGRLEFPGAGVDQLVGRRPWLDHLTPEGGDHGVRESAPAKVPYVAVRLQADDRGHAIDEP